MHVIVEGSLFMLFFFVIDLVILASYINVMNMPVGYFHVQNFDYAYWCTSLGPRVLFWQ